MSSILITGITGFLGSRIAKACLDRGLGVVGVAHSEIRDREFTSKYPSIQTYCADIAHDTELLDHIIRKHDVRYIIHTAAMKHIGVCESNPIKAINVNIFGSKKIASAALKSSVKNVIAISTDKSINPSCVYGSTKMLMEKLFLQLGYSVFQGVNFFFSTGSVLDIWDSCRMRGDPLTVNPTNTVRYFVEAEDVADKLLDNLDSKGETLYLETCYKVSLHDLYKAYADYHNYHNQEGYLTISAEKLIEEIPEGASVIDATPEILKEKFDNYYGNRS